MTKVAGFGGSELEDAGKVTGPGIVGSFKAAASIFTVAALYQTFRRTDSSASVMDFESMTVVATPEVLMVAEK